MHLHKNVAYLKILNAREKFIVWQLVANFADIGEINMQSVYMQNKITHLKNQFRENILFWIFVNFHISEK